MFRKILDLHHEWLALIRLLHQWCEKGITFVKSWLVWQTIASTDCEIHMPPWTPPAQMVHDWTGQVQSLWERYELCASENNVGLLRHAEISNCISAIGRYNMCTKLTPQLRFCKRASSARSSPRSSSTVVALKPRTFFTTSSLNTILSHPFHSSRHAKCIAIRYSDITGQNFPPIMVKCSMHLRVAYEHFAYSVASFTRCIISSNICFSESQINTPALLLNKPAML